MLSTEKVNRILYKSVEEARFDQNRALWLVQMQICYHAALQWHYSIWDKAVTLYEYKTIVE